MRMSLKNSSQEDSGDAFVTSLETHVGQSFWLIEYGDSFHMTSQWNWFSMEENMMVGWYT